MKGLTLLQTLKPIIILSFQDAYKGRLQHMEVTRPLHCPISLLSLKKRSGSTLLQHLATNAHALAPTSLTTVNVNAYVTARSPANFVLSRTFAPARWLPSTHKLYDPLFAADKKEASRPFSVGPRVCIGINLAYIEMRIIIAMMVWHFDWVWCNPALDWERDYQLYTLWKKPSLMVRYVPVERELLGGK
ncbi:MAG: hypothetical protein M1818_006341 [Claussenomyces sp. TS43310]|nr:MAG: hypothetical protein M1818_006341 [Claussenomyces sp. TS43310]